MMATRKKGEQDSQIKFSQTENSGILLMPRLNTAIYYVNGITVDTFRTIDKTVKEVEKWIEAKRKHYTDLNK